MTYATKTTVAVERSKAEIERLVTKAGATRFAQGTEPGVALVFFDLGARRVRFRIELPDVDDVKNPKRKEAATALAKKIEQARRARWRALTLVIKAKLEAIEQGIETIEEAFLAQLVLPNGDTFGEWAIPRIEDAYKGKALPPLLGNGSRR